MRAAVIGGGYDPASVPVFQAIANQTSLTKTRRRLIDGLFRGLRAGGWLDTCDTIILPASFDAQTALLDFKAPTRSWSAVNSPTFTPDRGYTGDAIAAQLTLNVALNTLTNFTQNRAYIFGYQRVAGANGAVLGVEGSPSARVFANAANFSHRLNDATVSAAVPVTRNGLLGTARTDAATRNSYYNGVNVEAQAAATTGIANGFLCALRSSASFYNTQIAFGIYGGRTDITAALVLGLEITVQTYMSGVGAAV